MKHFKNLNAVATASVEQLCEVKGMNKSVAQKIYDFYHKTSK